MRARQREREGGREESEREGRERREKRERERQREKGERENGERRDKKEIVNFKKKIQEISCDFFLLKFH